MEKKEFISQLRDELLKRGFKSETVEAEMIPVSNYFDDNGMTDIEIPVSDMADEISDMLREKGETPVTQSEPEIPEFDDIESALQASANDAVKPSLKAKQDTEPDILADIIDKTEEIRPEPEVSSEQPVAAEPDESDDDVKIAAPAVQKEEEKQDDIDIPEISDEELEQYRPGEKRDDVKNAGFIGKLIVKIREARRKNEDARDEYSSETSDEYDDKKFRILFWVLFAVALPFIIALAVLTVAIYLAFWILLALVMIVMITGLIAFVFAGVMVSLIGIIYGVIMIIQGSAPVGLFEIGLGITVGAVVMFAGILVYNFAVRLIPYAMKLLAKLLALAFRRGKEGLGSIRRLLQNV